MDTLFKALIVGTLALGLVFGGAATAFASQIDNPDAGPAVVEPGTVSETAKTVVYQYAHEFAHMFANKGELKGPFQNRFAQMFENAAGWELNELPENASADARTPDRTHLFSGMEFPVTPGPKAVGK